MLFSALGNFLSVPGAIVLERMFAQQQRVTWMRMDVIIIVITIIIMTMMIMILIMIIIMISPPSYRHCQKLTYASFEMASLE